STRLRSSARVGAGVVEEEPLGQRVGFEREDRTGQRRVQPRLRSGEEEKSSLPIYRKRCRRGLTGCSRSLSRGNTQVRWNGITPAAKSPAKPPAAPRVTPRAIPPAKPRVSGFPCASQ